MPLSRAIEPISDDDAAIRAALEDALVPPLLPALVHLTGDLTLLRPELRTNPAQVLEEQGGLTPQQQADTRELALRTLTEFRDGGCQQAPPPSTEDLRAILEFVTGGAATDEHLPLLVEELAPGDTDPRGPDWHKDEIAPDVPFLVAVIGAGMSGLLAAHRLHQAGVPFVVIDKNEDVGGTWFENTYPGARVDVPNHFYSFSFAQRHDWPQFFSTQEVLLEYFRDCVEDFALRDHIRFRTEVLSATFDDKRALWVLRLRTPDGGEEDLEAQAVVSAVGQLNRPHMPDIDGIEDFEGPSFHSARWDHDVDLTAKRVAVIGTGASAAQFVPEIAPDVSELLVFQRTPPWFFPTPEYHDEVPEGLRWMFRHVPHYSEWHRFWQFWASSEGLLPACRVDPHFQPQDRAVSAANDEVRVLLTAYLEDQFGDDPELFEKVLPTYPPASKRVLRDNGIWARTLKRDNVRVLTDKILEITPGGISTVDGDEYEVDVIIYGTGFHASKFLTPMRVVGRGGVDLHDHWDGNARAYLGITVPRFPSLFLLYGPNTNIVVNGSIIWFSECEVHYLVNSVRMLLEGRHRAMDPRPDVHDEYNVRIDEGNLQMAWGASSVNTWYKSPSGRVAQNWPFSMLEYWQQTRQPDPADYELL